MPRSRRCTRSKRRLARTGRARSRPVEDLALGNRPTTGGCFEAVTCWSHCVSRPDSRRSRSSWWANHIETSPGVRSGTRLHAAERVGTTQDEVPERSLRPDRIREQSDPSAVVVVIGKRWQVGSLALAPLLTRVSSRRCFPTNFPTMFPTMFPALFASIQGGAMGTGCGPGRLRAMLRGARSLPSRRVTGHTQRGRRRRSAGQRSVRAPSVEQRVQ